MAGKIMGRVFIRIGGMTMSSVPGSGKLNPGGVERTPVMSDRGFVGWTEKPVHAEIEADMIIDSDSDIVAISAITDESITFEADSGQVYIVRNAACAGPVVAQSGDGKAPVKFIGAPAEKA